MQLSQHFSLDEMIVSQEASRRGIDNTPMANIISALRYTCQRLEAVRTLLDRPLIVSSGYRCSALNAALGGVSTSAHVQGWAVDFIAPAFGNPIDVCLKIAEIPTIGFDQLINEGAHGASLGWIHLSFAPTFRRMCLTAQFASDGKARYSDGLGDGRGIT